MIEEHCDTDFIEQDLMDYQDTTGIKQTYTSNLGSICLQNNDRRSISLILQFLKNNERMCVCSIFMFITAHNPY